MRCDACDGQSLFARSSATYPERPTYTYCRNPRCYAARLGIVIVTPRRRA